MHCVDTDAVVSEEEENTMLVYLQQNVDRKQDINIQPSNRRLPPLFANQDAPRQVAQVAKHAGILDRTLLTRFV